MGNDVFIIVDMLNDFIDPAGALYCGDSVTPIVPFIKKRLDLYRRQNGSVIYLKDAHRPDDKEFEKFPPHCISGTWGSEIIKALLPTDKDQVLPKTRYSGFYGTCLEDILTGIQPGVVEVAGVCTSICVMDTVGGLANRDYTVRVYKEGVADFDQRAHEFSLQRMENIYGAEII
jgi:nicotinamidase/pyrazinamidase